ncbi:MAG TPA: muconolactone Delta-isomerase family protein [Ramlibacter sp.]|nr:muconolactone Delta-isomerase family protein [Ramlibacter sp.]
MLFMLNVRYAPQPQLGDEEAQALRRRHDEHVARLARQETLLGIWRIAGAQANYSLWQADSAEALHEVLSALPLFPHLQVDVTPLAQHPLGGHCRLSA